MNTELDPRIGVATAAEMEVFRALRGLPKGYEVEPRPESIAIMDGPRPYFYEPSLLVKDSTGRTLVVEAMSPLSMSWSNMVRFIQINRVAQEAGNGFLVLLPGEQVVRSTPLIPEFDAVNVVYGTDGPSFVRAVIDALRSMPQPNEVGLG